MGFVDAVGERGWDRRVGGEGEGEGGREGRERVQMSLARRTTFNIRRGMSS